jgi:hypothetical protein
MMWLGTAAFSIFGLILLRFRAEATQVRMNRLWLPSAILAASISFALLRVLGFPDLVPFWWVGAAAVAFCWVGFGFGIASVFGDVRQLVKSFFASLLGIAAIVEIWSLGHWLYEGVAPSVTFGSVGSDLEMNLAYANSGCFQPSLPPLGFPQSGYTFSRWCSLDSERRGLNDQRRLPANS